MQRFAKLWLENQDAVAGYIYLSVRDYHHAEDVLQEVAQSAAGSFDRYDPARPFAAWLIAIAKQRIADYYRRQGRRLPMLSGEAMEQLAVAHVDLAKDMDTRIAALQTCLSRLSDRHRHAIDMRYGQSMSPAQIAAKVGAKPTAVNALIYRIRKALEACVASQLQRRRP